MNFRINDLKNFLIVTSGKTMSAASKKLGITQPALSESIKRLEKDLKCVLFYRSRNGIQLTPIGKVVLDKAKNATSILGEIENIQGLGTQFGARVVTIGCHYSVALRHLPQALKYLEKVAPDYKIIFKHDLSRNIQSDIQQGLIDIGIVVNAIDSADLIIRDIGIDVVCVWGKKKTHSDKVFCNLDLIQTQHILRKWKNQPKTKIHTESLELIVKLAEEGLGHGIVPESLIKQSASNLIKDESAPMFNDKISVVYRPEFGKTVAEREVVLSLMNNTKNGFQKVRS